MIHRMLEPSKRPRISRMMPRTITVSYLRVGVRRPVPVYVEFSRGPAVRGLREERLMGFEPTTFCMASSADENDA
jgi:hypothetical protein